MLKFVMAATAAAALFVISPVAPAKAAGMTETSSQVSVTVGDRHGRWESRRRHSRIGSSRAHSRWESRRAARGRDCKTVRTVTRVDGERIVKTRRVCR
jgi:hypothetical protein